jgi:hypothetical protein
MVFESQLVKMGGQYEVGPPNKKKSADVYLRNLQFLKYDLQLFAINLQLLDGIWKSIYQVGGSTLWLSTNVVSFRR